MPEVTTAAEAPAQRADAAASSADLSPRSSRPGRPERLVHSMVATRAVTAVFSWLVHAATWSRNFFGASRRAFLADGQEANWTL